MEKIIEMNTMKKIKEHFHKLVEDKHWLKFDKIYENYEEDFFILYFNLIVKEDKIVRICLPIQKPTSISLLTDKNVESFYKTINLFLINNKYFEYLRNS